MRMNNQSIGSNAVLALLVAVAALGCASPTRPGCSASRMARRLPNAELVLYEDAGHGGVFQYHEAFVKKALEFLEA
jgi:pimeloyl-ACP methyl ester carboxylesterase